MNDICSWNYNRYFQTTKGRILGLIIKECLGTLVKISNNHNIGMISIVAGVSGFQFVIFKLFMFWSLSFADMIKGYLLSTKAE